MHSRTNHSREHQLVLICIIVGQALLGWAWFVRLMQIPTLVWLYQRGERAINAAFAVMLVVAASSAVAFAAS
jgi:hypothetical protein